MGRRLAGRLLLPIHGSLGAVTVVAPVQVSKPSRLASGLNRLKSNTKVRITSKGQVTIPQELRERFGLLPNTEVEFVVTPDGRELRLLKSSKPSPLSPFLLTNQSAGLLTKPSKKLTFAYYRLPGLSKRHWSWKTAAAMKAYGTLICGWQPPE